MAVIDFIDFEQFNDGQDVDIPGWTRSGAIYAYQAFALHGNMGAVTTSGSLARNYPSGRHHTQVVSLYIYIQRWEGSFIVPQATIARATMSNRFTAGSWRINSDLSVSVLNGNGTNASTSVAKLDKETWYRAEWMVNDQSLYQTLRVFEPESNIPFINISAQANGGIDILAVGSINPSATVGLSFDTITLAEDWVGPQFTPKWFLHSPTGGTPLADPTIVNRWGPPGGSGVTQ